MIDNVQYEKVLDSGLILDHYHLLCTIRDGGEVPKNKRIRGFLNLLVKKGYIEGGVLSDSALLLIDCYNTTTTTLTTTVAPVATGKFDYEAWAKGLHGRCQDKLKELTGKIQVTDRVGGKGKSWSFLPNSFDLAKVLYKTIVTYKLKDLDKIEKCVFHHINKCHRERSWFPLLKYYISKDGNSQLVTDLDNVEDVDTSGPKSSQKFV